MPDLIYSRAANNGTLTNEDVANRAPAVFAHNYSPDLSDRYGNFDSTHAIAVMADYGYNITQAAQVKGQSAKANIYGQHLLAFAKERNSVLATEQPEIIFYNSHDGKSSMKLFAGVFRFICSNGLIAGDGFDQKINHYKSNLDSFEDVLRYTAGKLDDIVTATETMKNITPNISQTHNFAKQAIETRYDYCNKNQDNMLNNGKVAFDDRSIKQALTPIRVQDEAKDAWTVFNRVQEAVMRGNFDVLGTRKSHGHKFVGYKESKKLTSIKQNVAVNRQLWDIATETLAA